VRQLIEGKLIEMYEEPQNVQVIVQGKNESAHMFLISENCTIKHAHDHVPHMSQLVDISQHEDSLVEPHSALRNSECELAELRQRVKQ